MLKMYQYRLYPTKKQVQKLNETLDECRWLYNHLLEMRKTAYERDGISLTCFQQQYTFPVLKHERITFKRDTFTHQESRQIADRFGVICVEDLHINRMTHNHCLAKS